MSTLFLREISSKMDIAAVRFAELDHLFNGPGQGV